MCRLPSRTTLQVDLVPMSENESGKSQEPSGQPGPLGSRSTKAPLPVARSSYRGALVPAGRLKQLGGRRKKKNLWHDSTLGKLHIVNWIAIGALVVFVLWAALAEIDQFTRASGQVIASSRTQIIQAPEGGVLDELLVKQGDVVQAGQLIAKLEKTKFESSYLETRAKSVALQAQVARLQAEVFGAEPKFPSEISDYPIFRQNQEALLKKRRSAIDEELGSIGQMLELAKKELSMNEPLLKTGDVSGAEVLRLQRQVADLQGQLANKRNKYLQDVQAELSKAEEELAGVKQQLSQRREILGYTELHAPVKGVVKNVRITTRGGVLRPGDELMQIVPLEDDLVIEAKVKPSDVAFLKPGLYASVKVDAYDYTIYGTLSGKLTYISPDTLEEGLKQGEQPYFRIQVTTDGKRFSGRPDADLDIQPGMTATVDLKTGSNTVLKYLSKPVVKTLEESMRER